MDISKKNTKNIKNNEIKHFDSHKVPDILVKLVKVVGYTFYSPAQLVILNALVQTCFIDEDSFLDVLKFDRRLFRQSIAKLKIDKLVKQKIVRDKLVNQQSNEQNQSQSNHPSSMITYYVYYINYKNFLMVVKHKTFSTKTKLEFDQKSQIVKHASFKCTNCQFSFTELDVHKLFNMSTSTLECNLCGSVVEETLIGSKDTQNVDEPLDKVNKKVLLALFNEQFNVLLDLISSCDKIIDDLSSEYIEPDISAESVVKKIKTNSNNLERTFDRSHSSVNNNEGLYHQIINININTNDQANSLISDEVSNKTLPLWLSNSTIVDENLSKINHSQLDSLNMNEIISKNGYNSDNDEVRENISSKHEQEILLQLLSNESCVSNNIKMPINESQTLANSIQNVNTNSQSSIQQPTTHITMHKSMNSIPTMTINGVSIPINSIDNKMIANMNENEIQLYNESLNNYYNSIC